MAFDLITRKRTGRDWSISIDGAPTTSAGLAEKSKTPWLVAGILGGLVGGYGIERNKKPAMYAGIGAAALSAYKLTREGLKSS
jgi:hypothetical protein